MKTNLAVLIVGASNSCKSTTINYFDRMNDENDREKKRCQIGWRRLQFFLGKLDALFSLVFFVPSSPTESKISLENKLKSFKPNIELFIPEMIVVAEQYQGIEYNNTREFLRNNDYEIVEFNIDNSMSGGVWSRWTNENRDYVLEQRSNEITNIFINFILNKIK